MELDLRTLNILVVEDNKQTMNLVHAILKGMNVGQIFTAQDGREAQMFLDEAGEMINFIICDWNMPRMTGLELLKQVRTFNTEIPFLMITARGTIDSVATAKKSGVSGYIAKPFAPAALEQKIVALARMVGSTCHYL